MITGVLGQVDQRKKEREEKEKPGAMKKFLISCFQTELSADSETMENISTFSARFFPKREKFCLKEDTFG